MSTSVIEHREASAQNVNVIEDALAVDLADGRTITVPLAWFPSLHFSPPIEGGLTRHLRSGL